LQGKTRGQYPAPLAILELLVDSAGDPLATACDKEAAAFAQLFGSPVNRALINVFFLRERMKRPAAELADARAAEVRRVSVVGAGTMGQGIAAACVRHGLPTVLGDASPEALDRGVRQALAEASYDRATGGPTTERALACGALLHGAVRATDVAAADLVIEAIVERLEVKQQLYAALEPLLARDAVLATNTSTLPIAQLGAELASPERFCGMHFFYPVRRMPLVEIVRGPRTSPAAIATAWTVARRMGKTPIVVGDGPGFLVNRILSPYVNEALALVEEGASPRRVDRAATDFGLPMGPCELLDAVGLDVAVHAGAVLQQAFPDRTRASQLLPALTAAGRLGKKSGCGFYDYAVGRKGPQASPQAESLIAAYRNEERRHDAEEMTYRLLLPMLVEAGHVLEDGVVDDPALVDLALIYGIGFPPHHGGLFYWADATGPERLKQEFERRAPCGARFRPGPWLQERLESGAPFYPSLARGK
jgi:3-hydroxyacyl-CoA dehydrogenase/enoyl-CoA hydratase/3-hydroxybutyryl-CoA epimerase/3-hydroxyacyl-CoA dehydrogenase/enoyl-CoA hydratase/3-hydroxybutyryl-CoA epimerase/enoyl-CoA isomerase